MCKGKTGAADKQALDEVVYSMGISCSTYKKAVYLVRYNFGGCLRQTAIIICRSSCSDLPSSHCNCWLVGGCRHGSIREGQEIILRFL